MYRPKDWKNPYKPELLENGLWSNSGFSECYDCFEAGADAMLEKLKDSGTFTYGYHSPDIDDQEIGGYWVFIPEES